MKEKTKYFVTRTTIGGVQYKRYKTTDGWSKTPDGCWQFSKQGAEKIAAQLNKLVHPSNRQRVHYDTVPVD